MAINVAAYFLFSTAVLFAQGVSSPSAAPSPNAKIGHVRLWNMILFNPTGLDLVVGTGPTAQKVDTASTGNFTAAYDSLPPGRYMLTVYRAGDRQAPLKSFDVPVADRSYFTVLVLQLPGGQPTIELLNDTPDPTKSPTNCLTVRQIALNSRAMVVTAEAQHTEPLEPGGTQTLEGLPDGIVPISASGTTGTARKDWNAQVDFRTSRHATVFIIADSYKRMRLRVTTNGPSLAEEAEAAKSKP